MDDKSPPGQSSLGGGKCQSCGMPLEIGLYGTNMDGTANSEYCKLCFEKGNFTEPKFTLDEMIGRSIANMVDEEDMNQEEAERLANATIPNLKRWQKTA